MSSGSHLLIPPLEGIKPASNLPQKDVWIPAVALSSFQRKQYKVDPAREINSQKDLQAKLHDNFSKVGKAYSLYCNVIRDTPNTSLLPAVEGIRFSKDVDLEHIIKFSMNLQKDGKSLKALFVNQLIYDEYKRRSIGLGLLKSIIQINKVIQGIKISENIKTKLMAQYQLTAKETMSIIDDLPLLPSNKIGFKAGCLFEIGYLLDEQKQYEAAIESYDEAINMMKSGLNEPEQCPMYGVCYHNKGVALDFLSRHNESITCYELAIAAKKLTRGYPSEAARSTDVQLSWQNLENAKQKLKGP